MSKFFPLAGKSWLIFSLASFCWLIFFLGCDPDEKKLRNQLNAVAESDLQDILNDLKTRGVDSLAHSLPTFVVDTIITFKGDTARKYAGMATVKYYYLNKLQFHQVRQYRYLTTAAFWERFDIKLKHTYTSHDSSESKAVE